LSKKKKPTSLVGTVGTISASLLRKNKPSQRAHSTDLYLGQLTQIPSGQALDLEKKWATNVYLWVKISLQCGK
jgi:hypothetical protein